MNMYGVDPSDRIWITNSTVNPGTSLISDPDDVTNLLSSSNPTADILVPIQVLKTALASPDRLVILRNVDDVSSSSSNRYVLFMHFHEVNQTLRAGDRVFDVYLNSELRLAGFDVIGNGSKSDYYNYSKVGLNVTSADGYLNVTLVKASGSVNGPILNAVEIFRVHEVVHETDFNDVEVIEDVRRELLESNDNNEVGEGWTGDLCLPVAWNGVGCDTDNGVPVITKLDLSSGIQRGSDENRILKGPFPKSITKLTNLRSLNLSNNAFVGQIPEFLQSSVLTSVDLSHNQLSGTLPKSLTSLQTLATLFYGCNPDLTEVSSSTFSTLINTTDDGKCGDHDSSKQRIVICAAAAVSGSLLVTAIAGVLFFKWREKFMPRGKFDNRLYPMAKDLIFSIPSMDDLMLKSISIETFTLDYLEAVTQSYKTLIGERGFSSVYRGTLTDGQEVAVKVSISNMNPRDWGI